MAGDHLAVARHQHRHRPAELRHGARDLRDLVRPVRLGVPRIGLQALERPLLDALRSEAQGHVRSSCREAGRIPGSGFRRWIPLGRGDSFRVQAEATPGRVQVFVLSRYQARRWIPGAGWLPKNSGLSLANCRAQPPGIQSAPERTRNFNGYRGASPGRTCLQAFALRKAKRPVSLSAAGRNASQGCLSTRPRKKSTPLSRSGCAFSFRRCIGHAGSSEVAPPDRRGGSPCAFGSSGEATSGTWRETALAAILEEMLERAYSERRRRIHIPAGLRCLIASLTSCATPFLTGGRPCAPNSMPVSTSSS